MAASQVSSAIRGQFDWDPRSSLVCLENTHNRAGGTIYPIEVFGEISAVARDRGLAMHLDGARIWNASIATGISEAEYAVHFDTISVCLSKGMGAPVGSLLVGSNEHIAHARRARKAFGGGMRQVGIIAAAALHALRHHRKDLAVAHSNARLLAEALGAFSSVQLDPSGVETNIVMFDVTDGRTAVETLAELAEAGVLMVPFGPTRIRATTHRDVSEADIQTAIARSASVLDRS